MEATASLITQCVDSTLSQIDFIDKQVFYKILESIYHLEPQEIGENFEVFHDAIKNEFGVKHFEIEKRIIKFLHEQSKNKKVDRIVEINAFCKITDVFSVEIKEDIERNRELASSKSYARRLEQRVKAYDEKLKTVEHLATIGQTAAMVGHDIRNPLQAIVGDIYLIDNDTASLPEGEVKKSIEESLKSIQANLYYINKIVSDLQDFGKVLKPTFEQVSIEKVIETALLIVPIPDNIGVVIGIESNFPPFKSDFYMLKRVLSNLLHNAVQAMPNGGRLTINACVVKNNIILEIRDTGLGIPEDIKTKLFTPMFTTKSKGQGFGLAVSKRLIEALQGTIDFESEIGKGTKFILKVPC